MIDVSDLPGSDRILKGLRDLGDGVVSYEACLAAIASRRLLELGLETPAGCVVPDEPELALYRMLCDSSGDAYYRYNAELRELDSFMDGLEARQRRSRQAAPS